MPDENNSIPIPPQAELSTADILNAIKQERETNEKHLAEMKGILAEQQKVAGRIALGGQSAAGSAPPKEKTMDDLAEEMAQISAKRYYSRPNG